MLLVFSKQINVVTSLSLDPLETKNPFTMKKTEKEGGAGDVSIRYGLIVSLRLKTYSLKASNKTLNFRID